MSCGLMNFIGLLCGVSRQITIAGGVCEFLPIEYYLENPSSRLIPVIECESSLLLLQQELVKHVEESVLGIGSTFPPLL